MSSQRKISANRRNARRSTGPRTHRGKTRASQNALRHGLAITLLRDPNLSNEVKQLAHVFAGEDSGPGQFEQAVTIAEMELDLRRIRAVRAAIMEKMSSALFGSVLSKSSESNLADYASDLLKIDRYERRALSRRKFAILALVGMNGSS
jgi:hypothetical protein